MLTIKSLQFSGLPSGSFKVLAHASGGYWDSNNLEKPKNGEISFVVPERKLDVGGMPSDELQITLYQKKSLSSALVSRQGKALLSSILADPVPLSFMIRYVSDLNHTFKFCCFRSYRWKTRSHARSKRCYAPLRRATRGGRTFFGQWYLSSA